MCAHCGLPGVALVQSLRDPGGGRLHFHASLITETNRPTELLPDVAPAHISQSKTSYLPTSTFREEGKSKLISCLEGRELRILGEWH